MKAPHFFIHSTHTHTSYPYVLQGKHARSGRNACIYPSPPPTAYTHKQILLHRMRWWVVVGGGDGAFYLYILWTSMPPPPCICELRHSTSRAHVHIILTHTNFHISIHSVAAALATQTGMEKTVSCTTITYSYRGKMIFSFFLAFSTAALNRMLDPCKYHACFFMRNIFMMGSNEHTMFVVYKKNVYRWS